MNYCVPRVGKQEIDLLRIIWQINQKKLRNTKTEDRGTETAHLGFVEISRKCGIWSRPVRLRGQRKSRCCTKPGQASSKSAELKLTKNSVCPTA